MSKKTKVTLIDAIPDEEKSEKVSLLPSVEDGEDNSDGSKLETVKDFAYGAAQGASFNLADEGYGAVKALADDRPFDQAYPHYRDEARKEWQEARDRSPYATFAGEVGGAVVSPVNKLIAPGRGVKNIIQAAMEGGAQSYGASDKESLKEQAVDTAKGMGVGSLTGAGMNYVTKRFSKSPNAVRAEVLGVKPKDYLVDGPGDRKQIVERIKDTGMLLNRKMEYDVDQMKFTTKSKSKFQIDELEKNTEDRLLSRAQDATNKLQQKKEAQYGRLLDNRFVSGANLDTMVDEIAEEYSKRGLIKGPMARNEAVSKIRENIYDQIMNLGGDVNRISLRELDIVKRMAQEDVRNFSKGLGELGDNDELARITARKLKHIVENNIGDQGFKKLNSAQHDFLTITGDLKNKIRSLELAAPNPQHLEKTNAVEGMLDGLFGGSQGRLDGAARKEWWQKNVPAPARAVIPYAAEEAPGAAFRERLQGQEPVSVPPLAKAPNIPEQLIRTPLPRSTAELNAQKSFVLAKVAQMMPEMFEAVKDTYEHEPERLAEVAQVLSMKAPHLFSRDKYNRFDGRILAEKDKQMAIKDTLLRKDISSIDQAKLITKLNEEGIFEA